MPSLIPGYEYDIFISYRQRDNKHDGWVTKFVKNLKGELEATFKEDISIYFDENPHDRLQETHDVGKSLEVKLKCLIFIPVLSQTYCDLYSYAWQNEFLTFLRMVENDPFGKDVKLRGGNVASRILPIRIHDLEPEDIKLFEKETGSVLRAMDFVFKTSSGVNRPLKANEDHSQDNLNRTFYGDQINKVAHAIREIIIGMKTEPVKLEKQIQHKGPIKEAWKDNNGKETVIRSIFNLKSRMWLVSTLALFLCVVIMFAVFKITEVSKKSRDILKLEKSLAVLPFINDSPDQENAYFINGIMDEILNNLQKIKEFRVLSRTSTAQFTGINRPTLPEIAKKLNVNFIVEGSGQKYGNKIVLRVQLIAANNERHLWANSYERELNAASDQIDLQSDIALSIATELKATITQEEKKIIEKIPTTNLTAYDFYQRGRDEHTKYMLEGKSNRLKNAISYYQLALKNDSTFAQAYTGLAHALLNSYWANVYMRTTFSESDLKLVQDSILSLVDRALTFDSRLDEAFLIRGWCTSDNNLALKEFRKALEINPNNSIAYSYIANILYYSKGESIEYIKNQLKAIELERGPFLPTLLKELGQWYEYYGFNKNAIDIYNQTFQLTKDTLQFYEDMSGPFYAEQNWKESIRWAKRILEKDPENLWAHYQLESIYSFLGKTDSATYYLKNIVSIDSSYWGTFTRGKLLWLSGNKKDSKVIFDTVAEFADNLVKSGINPDWNAFMLASMYSMEDDRKKAIKYLNRISMSLRTQRWFITQMENDPTLQNIRSDDEFQQILRTIKYDWQKEHDKIHTWLEENNML